MSMRSFAAYRWHAASQQCYSAAVSACNAYRSGGMQMPSQPQLCVVTRQSLLCLTLAITPHHWRVLLSTQQLLGC